MILTLSTTPHRRETAVQSRTVRPGDALNVTRCGWPVGRSVDDGTCGAPTTTVYVVEVHPLPVMHVTDDGYQAALAVCNDHDPNRPTSTSREGS